MKPTVGYVHEFIAAVLLTSATSLGYQLLEMKRGNFCLHNLVVAHASLTLEGVL